MKPTLLSVKELAQELGVSTQSIRRAYWDGLIPGYRFQKMLRFDVERIRQILLERGLVTMRPRRARPPAKAGGAHEKAPVR
ncbi:MAG: helix-turn-helix domain-containing protein [Nitrospirae bacterium]|jgi:hypothetical protein|nr:helix-turn-helix domain-containing protein [Nitrospirota bacterium]